MTMTRRVPVQLQGLVFGLLLAVAQSWLVAGASLVLSLIVTPMATAGLLTARFTPLLIYWMGFAAWSAWLGLWLAAQSIWLPTAFIATSSVGVASWRAVANRQDGWCASAAGIWTASAVSPAALIIEDPAVLRVVEIARCIASVRGGDLSVLGCYQRTAADCDLQLWNNTPIVGEE